MLGPTWEVHTSKNKKKIKVELKNIKKNDVDFSCFLVDVGKGVSMHTLARNFFKVLCKHLPSLKFHSMVNIIIFLPLSLPHPLPEALHLLFHPSLEFYQHVSFRHSSRPADGSETNENLGLIILDPERVHWGPPLIVPIYPGITQRMGETLT